MPTTLLRLIVAIVTFVVGTTMTFVWRNHDKRHGGTSAPITQQKDRSSDRFSVRIKEQANVPLRLESLMTGDDVTSENVHFAYTNVTEKTITDYVIDCERDFDPNYSMCGSMNSFRAMEPNQRCSYSFNSINRFVSSSQLEKLRGVILSVQAVNFSDGSRWERVEGSR